MTRFEAICGFCDERHVLATAKQRLDWLDYHWEQTGHDPDNAFLLDRPDTADETAPAQHPSGTPQRRTRPPADRADRVRDAVWDSIRKQREEKQ